MSLGANIRERLDFLPVDAGDPVDWTAAQLEETLWSKQVEIARAVRDWPRVAVQSAHSTGKSHVATRLATWWIDSHPVGQAFVVVTGPTQAQVDAIIFRGIRQAHGKAKLRGRITGGGNPAWRIGDELVALGRKSADMANAEEAAAAFQGIHARYLLVIIDEAGGVPPWLWEAVDSLASAEHSRVLAVGNPTDPASHFAKVCAPGSTWHTIQVSAFDTPNFTGEDVPAEVAEQLVSREWVERVRTEHGESSARWTSRVLGEFPDEADDALISRAWLRDAHDRALRADLPPVFGVDVARSGSDATAVYENRGGRARRVHRAEGHDLMRTTGVVARLLGEWRSTGHDVRAVVDADGVGAGVFDRLVEQGFRVVGFRAAQRAHRPDRFANRRAEAWWALREALREGLLDLDPADEELSRQLLEVRFFEDSSGRIRIESKDEMKRRGLRSPDEADALVMSLVAGTRFASVAWTRDAARSGRRRLSDDERHWQQFMRDGLGPWRSSPMEGVMRERF